MSVTRMIAVAALFAALPFVSITAAFAKPIVAVTLAQALVVIGADGSTHLATMNDGVPIGRGSEIRYTISAKDTSSDPARRLALTGHIPAGTAFTFGSVRGPGGQAEFSIDGKTFSARPMAPKSTPAGTVMVPVDPDSYVMVRWIKNGPLAARSAIAFSYDVHVK